MILDDMDPWIHGYGLDMDWIGYGYALILLTAMDMNIPWHLLVLNPYNHKKLTFQKSTLKPHMSSI